MVNLELELDEGIVLQTTEVERYGIKETSINEMVLTNKNIICVYNKSTGMFSKPETVVEKIPLSTIKVVNGKAQVMIHDNDDYSLGLQVLFISGHREHFLFYDEKKELPKWEKAIASVIEGADAKPEDSEDDFVPLEDDVIVSPSVEEDKTDNINKVVAGVSAGIFSAVKGAVSSVKQVVSEVSSEFTESKQNLESKTILTEEKIEENEAKGTHEESTTKYIYCSNCGEKLIFGSKFCNSCGVKVGVISANEPDNTKLENNEKASQVVMEDITERKNVYEGKIHKCPNCGDIIDAYETVCKSCGYEIRGRKATSSVRELQLKLEELHAKRPQKKMRSIFGQALSGGQLSSADEENAEDPFTSGFNDAMEESKKEIQKNVDEFYENLNGGGETSSTSEQ